MTAEYRQVIERLRQWFPQPISDKVHDAYFAFTVLRALDGVDALKSQTPVLGDSVAADFKNARLSRIAELGESLETVAPQLIEHLEGMFINGHPRSQINVTPQPTIASIIGVLLPAIYNPNLCSEESGRRVSEAEVRVAAMMIDLLGLPPETAGGVFTFGGTGCTLYGVKAGLEKAMPGASRVGLNGRAVVLASEHSHYACLSVASWLGIGQDQATLVRSHTDNSVDLAALASAAREALQRGDRIAAIVATMGSTDAFGIDNLQAIVALRDELVQEFSLDYKPHVHADAVIGWAWSMFNDYDFGANELRFRGRTLRALAAARHRIAHLHLADSIGIDFHKTGFAPYVSSLVMFRDRGDLDRIGRSKASMPYLYQTGHYHPGMFTLETTRAGGGPLAALGSLLLLGKQGFRVLLGHAVEMAEVLREHLESHPDLTVLNGENVGPVTLFRVYPPGVDTFSIKSREQHDESFRPQLREYNEYNRRVFQTAHAEALAGRGVAISLTDCYRQNDFGDPIVALKSYVLSPFSDESRMESIVKHVLAARPAGPTAS